MAVPGDGDDRPETTVPGDRPRRGPARGLVGGDVFRLPGERMLPERIGHFRILRLLGQGGMGSVYEAEQENPRRRVALKVLQSVIASADSRRRFEREVEILGRLQHPGIAHVYEAGYFESASLAEPQLYYALELIDGLRLNGHAESLHLDTRARVELMTHVCDAVQHAHERGIIHRDLKPENILVTADGQPKVLDFGVARLGDPSLRSTATRTMTGELLGTLPYMSPEQVYGDPSRVDARADVYALGVMIFELLTGRLPLDVLRRSPAEAIRMVAEAEPEHLGSLDRSLRGDLDTIVAKALSKDVDLRYASAADLAADLRRWLADEPIAARPPSFGHQVLRLARRHKAFAGAAIVAVAALVAATAVSLREAALSRASERSAVRQAYRAGLSAAAAAILDQDAEAARKQLDATPVALRGWEWNVLSAELDDSVAEWEPAPGRVVRFVVAEGGARVAAVVNEGKDGRRSLVAWSPADGRIQPSAHYSLDARPVRVPADLASLAASWLDFAPGETSVAFVDAATGAPLFTARRCGATDVPARTIGGAAARHFELLDVGVQDHSTQRICDLDGGRTLVEFPPAEGVMTAVFSAEGGIVAGASGLGGLASWSVATGAPLAKLGGELDLPTSLARRERDGLVAMGTLNAVLKTWDGRSEAPAASVRVRRSGSLLSLDFSPDGEELASGGSDGAVRIWPSSLAPETTVLHGHRGPVAAVAWLSASRVVSSDDQGHVLVFGTTSLADLAVLGRHDSYVYPVRTSEDSRLAVSGGWDGVARSWDLETREPGPAFRMPADVEDPHVYAVAFSPDGARVLAGSGTGDILAWDLRGGAVLARGAGNPRASVDGLWYVDGGRTLVAACGAFAEVLDADTLAPQRRLAAVTANMAMDASGQRLVGCAADAPPGLVVVSVATGSVLSRFTLDLTGLRRCAWLDATRVATSWEDGTVRIFDASRGTELRRLQAHVGRAFGLAVTPDGSRLATGGDDGVVRLWDTRTFDEVVQLRGHSAYVYTLAFTPDGRTLVSASGDRTVRAWGTRSMRDIVAAREGVIASPPAGSQDAGAH